MGDNMKQTLVYGIRCEKRDGDAYVHNLIYKNKYDAIEDMETWQQSFPENKYSLASFYLVV